MMSMDIQLIGIRLKSNQYAFIRGNRKRYRA